MSEDHGVVSDFCGSDKIDVHFSNALGSYTPCFLDSLVLTLCHIVGTLLIIFHWYQMKTSQAQLHALKGTPLVLQWIAFLASVICFAIPILELGARLGDSQILLSPSSSIAPFEYVGFGTAIVFWFVAFMVLYREKTRFLWNGLWMIRFALCLICTAQLAKFSFIVQKDQIDKDAYYALYMIYVICHITLAIFSLIQFPRSQNLIRRQFHGYEALVEEVQETRVLCDGEVCPERHVGLLSVLTFSWMSPLLRQGYKRPLEFDDIWSLDYPDHSRKLSSDFQRHWTKELELGKGRGSKRWDNPNLFRALKKTIGPLFYQAIPLKLMVDISQFVGPVFLDLLLSSVQDNEPSWRGYTYAFSMFVGLVIGTLADNQHFQRVMRAGFQLRSILTTEVQKKALFLTPTDRAKFPAGQIFNFVATDSESLQLVCNNILSIMSSPLRMIGAMILLFVQLGVSSLVAPASLVIMVPIQMSIVRWSAQYVKKALQQTDERAKLEREVVSGIEAVKCNAWEEPFWKRILKIRKVELSILWKSFVLGAINVFIVTSVPAIVSVSTFAVYVSLGNDLTASKAFVSLTLFNILRFPLFQLPQVITQLTQAGVSLRRLEGFMMSQEQPNEPPSDPVPKGEPAIVVKGNFTWNTKEDAVLKELDLLIPSGALTIVVGPTGSGKTSLLSSLLGLMQSVSGQGVTLHGSTSLVPQSPFIVNASVKENILFGLEYLETRYLVAISAASLGPDLQVFPGGDETELGEGGTNISGGQKQRIALARAVYANADICLLDDPLSALDTRVGRSVFNNCILGTMKGKTIILVTNQLQYVKHADKVLYLNSGRVVEEGTYSELMNRPNGAFAQMMNESQAEEESNDEDFEGEPESSTQLPSTSVADKSGADQGPSQLTQKERRSIGVVSWHVIKSYMGAMGGYTPFGILIFEFILAEMIRVGSTIWLTYWTNQGEHASHGQMFYMWIYASILFGQVLVVLANQLDFKRLGRLAAEVLHENMVFKLLRAPMAFYHTTPVGRIINRLTKDTADIDKNLVEYVSMFVRSGLQLFSTLILVSVITPLTLPVLACILVLFYFLYAYFQTTVREMKRLDAISRSPVYSSINDVLNGISTVRAFGAEERLLERHMRLVDDNIIMALLNQSTNRWLSIRLEVLGAFAALAAGLLTVEQGRSSSYMGLTLSYALSITMYTSITIRLASLAENIFNAVERVAEYSELEEEAPSEISDSVPPHWPDQGGVTFSSIKMSYREGLPLVLKGVSADIQPRQRVGVVGRTGAGKSSLMNALFRIVELSDGHIEIDGLDISRIGLKQLRSKIAIIPQKPILFAGTIRSNLDPFGNHSDNAIWTALTRAHLHQVVNSTGQGLEMSIQEGGAPLSEGQRQLLSLARAIIRQTKILILDEATANVDVDTDALIQETIKEQFADRTVIAIAHRLHTIIDGDKVMVLDKGSLGEFGSPAELLDDPHGIFTSMVKETGEATERFLRSVAFGEVNMREARAEGAAKGLERVRSVQLSAKAFTADLLNNAQQALHYLSNLREQLTECRRREQQRAPGDEIEDVDISRDGLFSNLKDTISMMTEIESVVKEAKEMLGERQSIFANVALLGSDMMESLGMSVDRQWNTISSSSSSVEIPPSPNTRRGIRRSLSVRQPRSSY
eukprot:g7724.t1